MKKQLERLEEMATLLFESDFAFPLGFVLSAMMVADLALATFFKMLPVFGPSKPINLMDLSNLLAMFFVGMILMIGHSIIKLIKTHIKS